MESVINDTITFDPGEVKVFKDGLFRITDRPRICRNLRFPSLI